MTYNGKEFDTSRLERHKHDTEDFHEMMEMVARLRAREEGDKSEKNVIIRSEDLPVIYSKYFADCKFSRG